MSLPVKPHVLRMIGETCFPGRYAFSLRGNDKNLFMAYLSYLKREYAHAISSISEADEPNINIHREYCVIVIFTNVDVYNALMGTNTVM